MFLKNKIRRGVGLDIGSNSIKAVELSCSKDGGVSLVSHKQLMLRAEGILDEAELKQSLSHWLDQSAWKKREICTGLPQYLATVQVMDFPEAPEAKLDEMISYETHQLSGISEEKFIHDYHVMPPRYGRKNPALIGISRLSAVTEKLNIMESAGFTPSDMTMNSMGLINTLLSLHPEVKDVSDPQMILEIGAENSTVVIFGGPQILFISTLMFGSDKYTRALADFLSLDEEKAEEEKFKTRIDLENSEHPFYHVSIKLISELENAIEQWKAHENSEMAGLDFVKIWLCGGGAMLGGLPEVLEGNFEHCQVEIYGPKDSEGKVLPELSTAYGLALQALEIEDVRISLAPPEISWVSLRKRNFAFLSAAVFLVIVALFIYLADFYIKLSNEDVANAKIISRLKACEGVIPELEKLGEDIRHYEKTLVPLAIKGDNIPRFISAINEIGKIKGDNFVFVNLADEKSFKGLKLERNAAKDAQSRIFFGNLTAKDPAGSSKKIRSESVSLTNMTENRSLVLIGFTIVSSKKEHYDVVRLIQTKLSQSTLFSTQSEEVDILSDEERMGREDIMSSPWISQVANNRDINSQLNGRRFRDFAIKLPFADTIVNQAELKETKTKEKKK
ncbi:MAG TPA: hypothetical protein DET40_20925 [Lentisphaeria bacterium]|nr:MAG: hypothetical protein A2X45_15545 [Lentisphaerae bacterium GWF2_50_93]HCE46016.1 hypothetical protein [Lentisphaeria bacterium]